MIGKVGRVTGTVTKDSVGEVMLPWHGGIEAFYAYPADEGETINPGSRVIVVDFEPPRTVTVTRYTY